MHHKVKRQVTAWEEVTTRRRMNVQNTHTVPQLKGIRAETRHRGFLNSQEAQKGCAVTTCCRSCDKLPHTWQLTQHTRPQSLRVRSWEQLCWVVPAQCVSEVALLTVAEAGASPEGLTGLQDLPGSVTWSLAFVPQFLAGCQQKASLSPSPDMGLSTGTLTTCILAFVCQRK